MSNFVRCDAKSGGGCRPCASSSGAGTNLGYSSKKECENPTKPSFWPVDCNSVCPGPIAIADGIPGEGYRYRKEKYTSAMPPCSRPGNYNNLNETWAIQKPFNL